MPSSGPRSRLQAAEFGHAPKPAPSISSHGRRRTRIRLSQASCAGRFSGFSTHFVASGRLIAAAEDASLRVGVDAKSQPPWLLTATKLSKPNGRVIADLIADLNCARETTSDFELGTLGRQVDWFPPSVLRELGRIVGWINSIRMAEPDRLVVASALSATVREASYARQSGWKLHRLDAAARADFMCAPWNWLERRLRYCLAETQFAKQLSGESLVVLATARSLAEDNNPVRAYGPYDVVLTSPPYGDGRTTVQYGAASSLCL